VAVKGISYRFSKADALTLNTFEKMWKRKCFPTPLPIVIDKREINSEIVKIFNEKSDPILYKDLIKKLFDRVNEKELSNYYLMNYRNTKGGIVLDDFDFIPLFRYRFDNTLMIENVTGSGFVNGGVFEKDITERIDNVFDFERIVVRTIFNNSLVKIKDDEYKTKYFGDIDSKYVYGGDLMWQLIMKYRKAFYDYIYKSRKNAITTYMFDDMMLTSILTNIRIDDINTRCEYNNAIKKKINIWFSIYYLFNNNKKETIMASHVTDLLSKMEAVAKGKSNIDSPEEFAFAAGQLASYLIDRSVASNKSYAMLEPYLQKCKSGQLEDAIAQTIAMYKHDISTYKGNFEMLSAQVLTYDNNVDLKPLLKYFLAGCFSHCVIYETRESNNQ
jgi:CRISPR-associated protein Csh1